MGWFYINDREIFIDVLGGFISESLGYLVRLKPYLNKVFPLVIEVLGSNSVIGDVDIEHLEDTLAC